MQQVVSLSGGKDSTAMLLMMLERGEPIDDIVFFDWGMEFPQMYEHLDKLESYIGRKITRLYPPHSFEYYMFDIVKTKGVAKGEKGYGWPGFHRRWCTRLKIQDGLDPFCNGKSVCVGISASEPRRITPKGHKRYPLVEWGITSRQALEFCYSKGFNFVGLYTLFERVSCWCCPFQKKRALLALREYFPDLWKKLLELDNRSLYPWPSNTLPMLRKLKKEEKQLKLMQV